jgi:hypothetical protein
MVITTRHALEEMLNDNMETYESVKLTSKVEYGEKQNTVILQKWDMSHL